MSRHKSNNFPPPAVTFPCVLISHLQAARRMASLIFPRFKHKVVCVMSAQVSLLACSYVFITTSSVSERQGQKNCSNRKGLSPIKNTLIVRKHHRVLLKWFSFSMQFEVALYVHTCGLLNKYSGKSKCKQTAILWPPLKLGVHYTDALNVNDADPLCCFGLKKLGIATLYSPSHDNK